MSLIAWRRTRVTPAADAAWQPDGGEPAIVSGYEINAALTIWTYAVYGAAGVPGSFVIGCWRECRVDAEPSLFFPLRADRRKQDIRKSYIGLGPGAVPHSLVPLWEAGTGWVTVSRASGNGGGRRSRGQHPRGHTVTVRLSDAELAALSAAAGRAGLALSAYLGQAAMDAACHRAAPVGAVQREALGELIRAAGLVRRAGVNLNQAVARLNATGAAGPDLGPATAYCMRVVRRVDEAALLINRGLR